MTSFTEKVFRAVSLIPLGETATYAELAARIGHPHASRAVGNALHRNPNPILVPCHRVVRSNGDTGKYVWGSAFKAWLLQHEAALLRTGCLLGGVDTGAIGDVFGRTHDRESRLSDRARRGRLSIRR